MYVLFCSSSSCPVHLQPSTNTVKQLVMPGPCPWLISSRASYPLKKKLWATKRCTHVILGLEKTLMLGKIEGRRRSGQQRMRFGWHHQLSGHESEQTVGDSEGPESLE